MGYSLHITRRAEWSEAGDDITLAEWLARVHADPELRHEPGRGDGVAVWGGPSELADPWLEWTAGRIDAKNPDAALITKMVAIASSLGASVQGDDGETYPLGVSTPPQRRSRPPREPRTPGERVARWLFTLGRPQPKPASADVTLPFGVGDRVRDTAGREWAVVAIEPAAAHGMGAIRLRGDDGRTVAHAMVAHGLERVVRGSDAA